VLSAYLRNLKRSQLPSKNARVARVRGESRNSRVGVVRSTTRVLVRLCPRSICVVARCASPTRGCHLEGSTRVHSQTTSGDARPRKLGHRSVVDRLQAAALLLMPGARPSTCPGEARTVREVTQAQALVQAWTSNGSARDDPLKRANSTHEPTVPSTLHPARGRALVRRAGAFAVYGPRGHDSTLPAARLPSAVVVRAPGQIRMCSGEQTRQHPQLEANPKLPSNPLRRQTQHH
jgi:hypothetical protein